MILYKWTHQMDTPPSIINSLICMAMHQSDVAPLWDGAPALESTLMLLTVCTVPFLLIPKPIILYLQNKSKVAQEQKDGIVHDEEHGGEEDDGHGHGAFKLDEVVIHQIIETIEYVLGTVSHTASYLRIWALSLAHQQLSLVFYSKTIQNGMAIENPITAGIVLWFLFGAWFATTVGVLLMMDVLECFLHTLR